ncbi:hypothetical protein LOAG_07068 [Loa loa]|uniref:Coiled-coil domain-containing protein 174 n=1 Tax=Loa loa TaxID=7209 RepID=A0A1I7V773_LOALO|nr:hypothetical protein LOAG_07068 [Loa loa]EFO21422.1 hypothetical protein LOAG_07068 [Loa loa]
MDVPGPSLSGREKHHLETSDASSLFLLKGELYRKINEQRQKSTTATAKVPGKKSVLRINKEEEKKIAEEKRQREARIRELEKSIAHDEEQRKRVQKILEEKSEIYARLSRGEEVLNGDNEPVEFLVDFNAKKREQEEQRLNDAEKAKNEKSEAIHFNPNEEQRVYGVSHVPLPVSETKRQEQIQELLELSKKTEINRAKRKQILEEREKKKWEQLNRVRKRKGLEELPLWKSEDDNEAKFLDIPLPDQAPIEACAGQSEPKKFTPVREWDRGKVLYDRWITKQRDERDDEFAPPSSYFK